MSESHVYSSHSISAERAGRPSRSSVHRIGIVGTPIS